MIFRLNLAPYVFEIETNSELVSKNAALIYGNDYSEDINCQDFVDFRLSIMTSSGIRRFFRPQARFMCDDKEPFKPLSANQAYAMLEWGMNWAIAAHELQYVIVHSAVLAKNGKAIMFPAPPGSGKSTLTAHLANNGWRLLSDEMALITPGTKTVNPFVRPVCLKNQSINLAKSWFPDVTFSTIATHTHKGDVIHMAAPALSSLAMSETAEIVGIVFPQYQSDTALDIYQLDMSSTFLRLIENAFNLKAIGDEGFKTAVELIEDCARFEINYNDLNEVESFLDEEIIDAH